MTVFFMSLHRSPGATIVTDCFIRPQRTTANAVLNLMAGMAAATILYLIVVRENRFVEEVRKANEELGLIDDKTDVTDSTPTKLNASAVDD